MNIKQLVADSYATARQSAWWDDGLAGPNGIIRPKTFPTTIPEMPISLELVIGLLMLKVTELAEATEELRSGRTPTEVYWKNKKTGKVTTLESGTLPHPNTDEMKHLIALGFKPEGIPIELADVVIRIADLCGLLGVDLEAALQIKAEYNRTRP